MSSMVEVKVSELSEAALDWAVAHAVKAWESAHEPFPTMTLDPTFSGVEARPYPRGEYGSMLPTCVLIPNNPFRQDPQAFCPSTDWSQGGPLIEMHGLHVWPHANGWSASAKKDDRLWWPGIPSDSPLIASCRAIVAAKLGETVQIPQELLP